MLARLQTQPGGIAAEVDRRGEALRLQLAADAVLPSVQRVLEDLGFGGEVLAAGGAPQTDRYGPGTVRELSREEASVIARRVVGPFGRTHHLQADVLVSLVTDALHERFVAHVPGGAVSLGALRRAAAEAVEAAVRQDLGSDLARALADAVEADLARGAPTPD